MITLIEARGYKSLRHIRQPLGRFHILVGPNASGKSSFFDAIVFLGDVLREGPQKAVEKRCRSLQELTWMGEANAFELAAEMSPPEALLGERNLGYRRCRYEIRVGVSSQGDGVQLLEENFWLLKDSQASPRGLRLSLEQKQEENAPSFQPSPQRRRDVLLYRWENEQVLLRSETTRWSFVFRPPPARAALSAIPEDINRFPVSIWAKDFLTRKVRHLMLDEQAMRRPSHPSAPNDVLLSDGSNLALVVRHIQEHYPQMFYWWVRHVQTFSPGVQGVEVREREEDRHLYLVVRFGETAVPSWSLSGGVLKLLALTILAYLPSGSTYLIEEPESSIHPSAIEGVFQSLSSVYDGQVLLATHSASLVGLAKPEHLLCFAKTGQQTVVVRGDMHPMLREQQTIIDISTLYASGALDSPVVSS